MNDREIDILLRMAVEVDQLEDSMTDAAADSRSALNGAAPSLRYVHESAPRGQGAQPARRRMVIAPWMGSAAVLAAAACVVFGIVYFASPGPARPGPNIVRLHPTPSVPDPLPAVANVEKPTPHNQGPTSVNVLPDTELTEALPQPAPGEKCVVLAVFRDSRGGIGCVQWSPYHPERGRSLSEIAPSELRCVSFGPPCSTTLQRTILIALSGPRESIPETDRGAEALARCILETPHVCADDSANCVAHAASACLPKDVTVRVESVALSQH